MASKQKKNGSTHLTGPKALKGSATQDFYVQLATRVPAPLHRQLKLYCVHNQVTIQVALQEAIRKFLQEQPAAKAAKTVTAKKVQAKIASIVTT